MKTIGNQRRAMDSYINALKLLAEATPANVKHHLDRSESDRYGKVLNVYLPRSRHEMSHRNAAPVGWSRAIYPV